MDAVVAVVGTLAGTVLGALGTYLTQASAYKRESRERWLELRRSVYVAWLAECQKLFSATRRVLEDGQQGVNEPADVEERLRAVSTDAAEAAHEHLRLVADQEVAAAARVLWAHLRRGGFKVARGQAVANDWSKEYWGHRRSFIDAARAELRLAPFDWTLVGT